MNIVGGCFSSGCFSLLLKTTTRTTPLISRILSLTISTVMLLLVCSQGMLLVLFQDLPCFFCFIYVHNSKWKQKRIKTEKTHAGGGGVEGWEEWGRGWRGGVGGVEEGGDLSMRQG